jgi:ArsR family transcriptional regulator, arsenate/arsenite/antimonite-responsive transcriptional repressor
MSEHVSSIDVNDLTPIARIFRLASHPSRLRVLLALAPAEIDTSRIPEVLHDLDAQVVAHQLAFLQEGGLARRRQIGMHAAYRLTKAGACVAQACQNMLGDLGAATTGGSDQAPITHETPFLAERASSGYSSDLVDALSLLIHAADSLRLRLLLQLSEGACDSARLSEDLGDIGLMRVSGKLGVLRSGKLVTWQHSGRQRIYHLTANGLGLVQVVRATCSGLTIRRGKLILRPEPIKKGEEGALDPTSPEGLACLLRTFAHPIRLRILNLLVEFQEVCECHLPTALEVPAGLVTQSLSRPKKNGLLVTRREGKWAFIRAAHSASNLFRSLMGCFGSRLADAAIFDTDRTRLHSLSPCERFRLPSIPEPEAGPRKAGHGQSHGARDSRTA